MRLRGAGEKKGESGAYVNFQGSRKEEAERVARKTGGAELVVSSHRCVASKEQCDRQTG